ncbi:MAG: hypothetical protein E7452_07550 [Ruminococcaceae bacterium]|nr:hypothetical protein [Oscillospiraceae bacterium]
MKKVLAIFLAVVMMASMSLSVLAVSDNFLESPSKRVGPELVDFSGVAEGCTVALRVVPFSNRSIMDEAMRLVLEESYDTIVNTANVGDLNADLNKKANELNIPAQYLVVSDLFDVHTIGCDLPHHHGPYTVTISADLLERFVGLIHYKNSAWELITSASVSGDNLTFTVNELSPFAIVINTDPDFVDPSQGGEDNPPTGDDSHIGIYVAVMVVAGLAMIALWRSSKKQSSK